MADWRNISDTEVDPDAPVTSELAYAFRDNVIAVTEGASGAPRVNAISAMSHQGVQGRIGTFCLAIKSIQGGSADQISFGDTRSGSLLAPASAAGTSLSGSSSLDGSWRAMGNCTGSADGTPGRTTLWLRIS